MEYLVDVTMPVYNHEKYIAQAIESIVNQKTTFKYRLIVGEDKSTDNSRAILADYAARYPDKIVPVYHEKNLGAQGNGNFLVSMLKAKYVAICEGDDYWTDEYKLQKQVDFMEANPDFTMCFTDVTIVDEMGVNRAYNDYFPPIKNDVLTIDDFILSFMSVIPTPTLLFRNVLPTPLPAFYLHTVSADICLHFLLADKGKAKYMPIKTAAYRNHAGGLTKTKEVIIGCDDMRYRLYKDANQYFNFKYDASFKKQMLNMTRVRILFGSKDKGVFFKIKNLIKNYPDYIRYSDKVNFKEMAYHITVLFFPSLLKLAKKKW